jgi:hypothetical protein
MLVLAVLFALAVVGFGGWQGVRSLVGLVVSFAVIVGFIVPAILRGHSPVPVAPVGAMAIMLASLYLSHGVGRKTTAAVAATSLAGLASEEARGASFEVGGLSLRGLLLRSALTVGRDHIAATLNTLFLGGRRDRRPGRPGRVVGRRPPGRGRAQSAAAGAAGGGLWYRRAMQAGTASLDLRDPGQLDLLRRYGGYSTDARVWVEDDPAPVIECTETLDGEPASATAWTRRSGSACGSPWRRPAWPTSPWSRAARGSGPATTEDHARGGLSG